MPNQWKPTRESAACLILVSVSRLTLVPAPKDDVEPHARKYHRWGVPHTKLLVLLKNHFDTEKFGLGYMFYIAFVGLR